MEEKDLIEWKRLRILAQRVGFGELRVIIQNGKPVRVETAIKQIKLDTPEDFAQGLDIIPM